MATTQLSGHMDALSPGTHLRPIPGDLVPNMTHVCTAGDSPNPVGSLPEPLLPRAIGA